MTEVHERRISYDELHRIAYSCRKCQCEVIIDVTNAEQMKKIGPIGLSSRAKTPADQLYCTFCEEPLDRYLLESFFYFLEWRKRIADSDRPVYFLVSVPAPRPEGR